MKLQPIQDFLNLLFPRLCPTCDRPLSRFEPHWCLHCEQELPFIIDQEKQVVKLAGRLPFDTIYSLLKFTPKGMVQQLLHEIKYRGNTSMAEFLGQKMAKRFQAELSQLDLDYIVPVPLHASKLKKRGYNQSMFIATGIAKTLQVPVNEKILIRKLKSETQTLKSRQERWQNVSEIFAVQKNEEVRNKHILIVDDVFTTGATLEACGAKLVEQGARISFATIASA